MPVYKNTAQNQKLGRVGKEYGMKGQTGTLGAQGGVNVPLKGAASKQGLVAKQKMVGKAADQVYKDTPNNRKLGRVGKKFGTYKEHVVPLKVIQQGVKDKAAAGVKPGIDKDLFMDALNQMTMLAKSKGKSKENIIRLKADLNKIKGRPSLSLFRSILFSNPEVLEEVYDHEGGMSMEQSENMDFWIKKIYKGKKPKTFDELSDKMRWEVSSRMSNDIEGKRTRFLTNAWNTIVKGPGSKMKRWTYEELVEVGKEIYSKVALY